MELSRETKEAIDAIPAIVTQVHDTVYTLIELDNNNIIEFDNSSAITLTIPVLPKGFHCTIAQMGTGTITFTAGAGITLHNRPSHTTTAGQYALATITVVNANIALLAGDTA